MFSIYKIDIGYKKPQLNNRFFLCHAMRCVVICSMFFFSPCMAQVTPPPAQVINEQHVENITAGNDDTDIEDDTYQQQLQEFLKDPVELNTADEETLKALLVLNPLQIQYFMQYRIFFGKLVSIYELQAIPGWDIITINKILPYVSVSNRVNSFVTLRKRVRGGDHSILLRATQVLEQSKGYTPDTSKAYYLGSPQKLLIRYKYSYKNLLQYGIIAEKDAGEQFFKGAQQKGFDYYAIHFFARNLGAIRSLAIGDYTVNLGQGLISWQSLGFKKGPDVTSIKRQSAVLRPYNASGETNFHRGIGITVSKKKWEATVFASYRKIDGNLVIDSISSEEEFISSLQTSGYHRTKNEVADKGIQQQLAFGGNLAYRQRKWHLGLNSVQYKFRFPLQKSPDPYNKYALSGKAFGNSSIDYSYTHKNLHFFGEAAVTNTLNKAFLNGLMMSVASTVDVGLLYRNIEKNYQSIYSSAFTEGTFPTNEKGFFCGAGIKPSMHWRVDAYFDMYSFPWLKYRVDRPSGGSDYFIQLTYKPNKQLEIYTRFRSEAKALNSNSDTVILPTVTAQPKQNWRVNTEYRINAAITIRNRVEMVWSNKRSNAAETGFLCYIDLLFKPLLRPFSATMRLQYFETDGYNSRIYAFENDVLYSYSVPVSYGKGLRYYININYDINKKLSVWVRAAQTHFKDRTLIGSGLDEISGTYRTEAKLQVQYRF